MCVLKQTRSPLKLAVLVAAAGGLALATPAAAFASNHYSGHHGRVSHAPVRNNDDITVHQGNLASDVPGLAALTDPDLKNPWGASFTATSPLWTSNQATNSSTLYTVTPGSDAVTKSATVRVTFPDSPAGPTGQVANTGTGFVLTNGAKSAPAAFIFDTLNGHIDAWSPAAGDPTLGAVEQKAVGAPGSAYTGLAMVSTASGAQQLLAANTSLGRIDVFDSSYKPVKTASWQFRDNSVPKGWTPYNVQTLGDNVFVTYAKPNAGGHGDVAGKGLGVVDEYDAAGHLISRVASPGDKVNVPWGLAIAPASWGNEAGSLLIGNLGDGTISIVGQKDGLFDHKVEGQVRTQSGKVFSEPGLWSLTQGTAVNGGTDAILFTAGINNQQDGLLGVLRKG